MTSEHGPVMVSHIGICVSDLERSLRFYCDGLGFSKEERHDIGNEFAATLEVEPDVELVSQFIRKEGMAIELLHYRSPVATGTPSASRGQLGLTHLSFIVPDVDTVAADLVAAGGTVVDSTRTKAPDIDLVFLADPDGVRIELMQFGGGE